MRIRARSQRTRTPDVRAPGARGKAKSALTAVAGTAVETVVETVKEGIARGSTELGKMAGVGLVAGAELLAGTQGAHVSPFIAATALLVGAKLGSVAQRRLQASVNVLARKVGSGGGEGDIAKVLRGMLDSVVVIGDASRGVLGAVETVNLAQAYYQKVSEGTDNNFVASANKHCQAVPALLAQGRDILAAVQEKIVEHLAVVATEGSR